MSKRLSPRERQVLTWRIIAIVASVLATMAFISVFATAASMEQNLVDIKTGIIMFIISFAALVALGKFAQLGFGFCRSLQESLRNSSTRHEQRKIANCR